MGQRFEQNRTKVTENRTENERIKREQTTLTREYSPLYEINSFLDSLDDEIIASVEDVQEVGISEQSRIDKEREEVGNEADEIASQLDEEIGKLDTGMKKLDQLEAFGYGQQALDKGKSDYRKQIEQYKALKAELEEIQESGDTSRLDQVVSTYAEQVQAVTDGKDNSEHGAPPNATLNTTSNYFDNYDYEKHINGSDVFIKGDNYDSFRDDYYSAGDSVFIPYEEHVERTISPSLIEGIHLGEREVKNPELFWSQHESHGTAESFREIASHIPEISSMLDRGTPIEEIQNNPELEACVNLYFVNKPRVIEHDGYYEFDSNGRHRILAARDLGYDIPVEVIGKRNRL